MLRRSDRLTDRLWRYRGVALVVAVPVIMLVFIIGFFPRGSLPSEATGVTQLRASPAAEGKAKAGAGDGPFTYNIVLDAGSTGSRIHVFKFEGSGKDLKLLSDTFHALKPGLSSFADKPEEAAQSLKPLLKEALAIVPKEQQASTGLSLKATAGLRLLPGDKADNILKAVRTYLKSQPFSVNDDAVGIMDGAHEGAFAWLTLNYLLGKLGGDPSATVAAIDLGGGSVQEAFALPNDAAQAAPEGYVTKLKGAGKTYSVYVHSYLGYGLMAARAKVIDAGAKGGKGHPCFSKGTQLKYEYAGKEYPVEEVEEHGDFKTCASTAFKALQHGAECGAPEDTCSFAGAWRGKPSAMPRVYYVSSYFWDRAVESGIIADKAATDFKTTPGDFARRAAAACGKAPAEVAKSFPEVQEAHAPFFCLDLSFCHTVLSQGFDLAEDAAITLVKQVNYNGQKVEAAWPLGAAINDLS